MLHPMVGVRAGAEIAASLGSLASPVLFNNSPYFGQNNQS
jgi:hypothetical protein